MYKLPQGETATIAMVSLSFYSAMLKTQCRDTCDCPRNATIVDHLHARVPRTLFLMGSLLLVAHQYSRYFGSSK